nr:glycoside hydrolase family 6 protein [Kineosporia mesophila]
MTVVAARAEEPSVAAASGFYVDPRSGPAQWVAAHPADGRAAGIKSSISSKPMARWFGDWSGNIGTAVGGYVGAAARAGKMPVLVSYNLPQIDVCGKESADGGSSGASAYRTWIAAFADSIRDRPAMVILEPDSLADLDCLGASAASTRLGLLKFATEQFRDRAPKATVYLDGGNSVYRTAPVTADRLSKAGIQNVRGFSLNVSNFHTTAQESAFAEKVNDQLAAQGLERVPYVVDTSRNGKGGNGSWCNPDARQIGTTSAIQDLDGKGLEARIWIKAPGQSDGTCGIAPNTPAGTFDPQIAYDLIHGY